LVLGVGFPSIDHPGFLFWEIIVSNMFDRVMAVFAGHRNPSALDLLFDSSDKTGPILTMHHPIVADDVVVEIPGMKNFNTLKNFEALGVGHDLNQSDRFSTDPKGRQ
jgi:hypothetical protein